MNVIETLSIDDRMALFVLQRKIQDTVHDK